MNSVDDEENHEMIANAFLKLFYLFQTWLKHLRMLHFPGSYILKKHYSRIVVLKEVRVLASRTLNIWN